MSHSPVFRASKRAREILAENIEKALAERNEKVVPFADRAAVSKSQVYGILAGKISAQIDTVALIADELGLAPWQLLLPSDVAKELQAAGIETGGGKSGARETSKRRRSSDE
jgi:transcriptional regulator with XRE-family HTH domain